MDITAALKKLNVPSLTRMDDKMIRGTTFSQKECSEGEMHVIEKCGHIYGKISVWNL
jgi:hypothetical protein